MQVISQTENKAVVLYNNKFYLVSQSSRFGLETLIFNSDSQGNVSDWIDVGGENMTTLGEVLANFSDYLY